MRVGRRTGLLLDPSRPDWDGHGSRPIRWTAWYPTLDMAVETPILPAGHKDGWFTLGTAAQDAPLAPARRPYPVALLSHGTGGTASELGWLGQRLARQGVVSFAADHHGNTGVEPVRPEGFLCWWERAADLSRLLDRVATAGHFAGALASRGALAVGFSLGAHTALALLGAITDMQAYGRWAGDGPFSRGPGNFPDLADRVPALMAGHEVFRQSWARQGQPYRDARVGAALLLAPAPPVRAFTESSLTAITAPVHVMTGGADRDAPVAAGASWLAEELPRCTVDVVAPDGGHFLFVPEGNEDGRRMAPWLCCDPPGLDRAAVHDAVAAEAIRLLDL